MSSDAADVPRIQALLRLGDRTVDWCVRQGERARYRREHDRAAEWARLAAETARRTPGSLLAVPGIEQLITGLARGVLPHAHGRRKDGLHRWLHVVTDSFDVGGLTALSRRWIARSPRQERHDVLLTGQSASGIAAGLRGAVEASGGEVLSVSGLASTIARAAAIQRAAEHADVVVLCIHPWDVAPLMALGQPGGPPVLLLNHQDHAFWAGSGVSDVVVDIRASGSYLTRTYRGARAGFELPVPLEDLGPVGSDRRKARRSLVVFDGAIDALGLLTVGRAEKYARSPGLDFLETAGRLLGQLPDARLVAVGPSPEDGEWRTLSESTGGRAIAVGEQPNLRPWYEAADVYLEGFPIGSYTALLEAALAGLAVVRKPLLVPPDVLPLDAGALAHIPVARDVNEYARFATALALDPARREGEGSANRIAVVGHHCGEAWDAQLASLKKAVPREHDTVVPGTVRPMPFDLAAYWARYRIATGTPDPCRFTFATALKRGLRPVIDGDMRRALADARHAGLDSVAPARGWLGSRVLRTLPARIAERLYWGL